VKTQDQFGYDSVNGLATNKNVTLAITTGTGTLQGTTTLDIGIAGGNGTATFTDLKVGLGGAVGTGKKLTASASGLTSSPESSAFDITTRAITVTASDNTKIYDANLTAAALPTITSGNLAAGDAGIYTETYSTKVIGTGNKTLIPTVTSILAGAVDVSANYFVTLSNFTTGTINAKPLTVSGITAADKTYDTNTTVVLNTASSAFVGIESGDTVTIDVA